MKTTVKGIVMEKNKRTSKDGQNTYFSFNIFQKGETDLLVIKCSEQQFAGIKEGETVQVEISATPYINSYSNSAQLSCKLI